MLKHLIAVLITAIAPSLLLAQPLADRVPPDAIVYIGWQGSQAMPPAYAESHLKAVVDGSNFAALISDVAPQLVTRLSKGDPQAGAIMQMVKTFGTPLWRHPSAIFVGPFDFNAPGAPRPHLGILCQAGADADALLGQLKPLMDAARGVPFPVKVFNDGTLVVLSIGYDRQADVLASRTAALPTNPRFQQAIAQVQNDPVMVAYIDVEAALAQMNDGVAAQAPADAARWAKIRDALGLPGIKRFILTGGFEGRNWSTRGFIEAPAPRKGLAAFLESPPITNAAYKLIPQSAIAAGVERFDLSALLQVFRTISGQIDPNGLAGFDRGLAEAKQATGIDLQHDLADAFGDEWIYYCNANPGNPLQPTDLVVINQLRKPADAERSLNRLEQLAQNALRAAPAALVTISQEKAGALTIHKLTLPQGAFEWTISDGRFCLATSSQGLAAATQPAPGGKTILDNPDFTALRQRLDASRAVSFNYADLPKTASLIYPGLLQLEQFGFAAARQAGIQPPANVLPAVDLVLAQLSPSASFTWADAAGWHARGVSPFPGSTALSPNGSMTTIGATALAASIMLPALNAAKERANRVKCASNLRQIGQGMLLYANDHKKYPADLGLLVTDTDINPQVFVCPSSDNEVPISVRVAGPKAQAKWVVEHSSYIYLGASRSPNESADVVVAYDKFDNHETEGINILFNDGHVEWQTAAEAKRTIKGQVPDAPGVN